MTKKALKKDKKVNLARKTIIGFITLVVVAAGGFGIYVSTDLSGSGDIVENEDYLVIENARPRRTGDPIEVVEFFSYSCIHCKTFDPIVEEWAAAQQGDVVFKRKPASFSPAWSLLAQAYFTLEAADVLEQNHSRLFRAIHDSRRQFLNPEMIADFVDGRGISREDFLREFKSPNVRAAMRDADRDQRKYQISATPSLVIAGKYLVGMGGGQSKALRTTDILIARERGLTDSPE